MENDKFYDSSELISLIIKNKRIFTYVAIASIVISAVVSLILSDKYRASVIMYPSMTNSISAALLDENVSDKDYMEFGKEEEVEKVLQVLNSDEVREKVIHKFNLMNHYDIDPTGSYPQTKVRKKFAKNIHFNKTKFTSVEIEVFDTDPEQAAQIANYIAALLDTAKTKIHRTIAIKALDIIDNEYKTTTAKINKIVDSLNVLRKMGLYNYEDQSSVLTEAHALALVKGNQSAVNVLENKLELVSKYGGAFSDLNNQLYYERKHLGIIKGKLAKATVDVEQNLPHKFVVNKATRPEKKTYPIRSLIVIISLFSSLFLTLLVFLFQEKLKQSNLI